MMNFTDLNHSQLRFRFLLPWGIMSGFFSRLPSLSAGVVLRSVSSRQQEKHEVVIIRIIIL